MDDGVINNNYFIYFVYIIYFPLCVQQIKKRTYSRLLGEETSGNHQAYRRGHLTPTSFHDDDCLTDKVKQSSFTHLDFQRTYVVSWTSFSTEIFSVTRKPMMRVCTVALCNNRRTL